MDTKVFIASTALFNKVEFFNAAFKQVPEYRQKKIDFYKFQKDKNLCLGAGFLLTCALKSLGIKESDLQIAYEETGKPYFKNRPELNFSLSHSGERVMCAIGDKNLGCDVEEIAANEQSDFEQVDLDKWTQIESYAKAANIQLDLVLNGKVKLEKKYKMRSIEKNDGYIYKVCSEDTVSDSNIIDVDFEKYL